LDTQKKTKADPKNEVKVKLHIENSTASNNDEIASLRNDVQSLKRDMQEILPILHAAYEIE
jgi:hypothetical protein